MKLEKYIPTSLIDYPEHIACVVFTIGCNWNCWYCQNRPLINQTKSMLSETEFIEFLQSRKNWLDGVVVCGGEPTLHPDLPAFISLIKSMGFDVKLDTNGSNPTMLQQLIQSNLIDYVAMDIKSPLTKYSQICGVNIDITKIQQSIDILKNCNKDYEFRTTVSPDLSLQDLTDIATLIQGAKVYYLQKYIPPDTDFPVSHTMQFLQNAVEQCNQITSTKLR